MSPHRRGEMDKSLDVVYLRGPHSANVLCVYECLRVLQRRAYDTQIGFNCEAG